MIDFALGVAVGAAFAPFWIGVWNFAKTKFNEFKSKD